MGMLRNVGKTSPMVQMLLCTYISFYYVYKMVFYIAVSHFLEKPH